MQHADAGPPVTEISRAFPDRIEVRGRDLCAELMGRLTFSEYFFLLLTGSEPTVEQRFFLDLLLVAIAEHGLMPTTVAARMTLSADPGSLQGAVAAGILGAGPVLLGTAEPCARLLVSARARTAAGADPAVAAAEEVDAITARSTRAASGSSSWPRRTGSPGRTSTSRSSSARLSPPRTAAPCR
jgi:citrate synthase